MHVQLVIEGEINMDEKITKLCDKLERLLEEEEAHFTEGTTETFHPMTWKTWAELREILTGRDCM
jgi:hypothetical protein